ncbi:MAG: MTAP family purine nucleoside phosphorylase [Bacteroidota bacterium]|nr:MTAP family purine nucleoside phosphorylase [Bacteroidota bacterium]
MTKIAIIGGSGLENPAILKNATELKIDTPYGSTTSDFKCGTINGREVAILSRHGRQHTIPPTQVNNRANIWAIRERGTVVTIEGPRFSTRAESNMFRLWGADVINMSTAPEVILANELGIPYAAIAMSTDYDCWKTDEAPVTWGDVLKVFNKNVSHVIDLLIHVIGKI